MITEPKIDKQLLVDLLKNNYSLESPNVVFLPRGETSWGYIVEADTKKYFLKVYKNTYPFFEQAAELTYKLFADCGIKEIVHALKSSNGEVISHIEEYPVILFNFIDGKEISEQKPSDEQVKEIGVILGKIHASTSKLGPYPKRETFESKDKEMFLKVMDRVRNHQPIENSYQKEIVDLFNSHRSRIEEQLTELEKIGEQLKNKKNLPFVICHSDPTPGNILIGKDGIPYLIDWDTPIFAPKERDLLFFSDRLKPFMEGYCSIVGESTIDDEVKQFYAYEWNVQEVADFGSSILFGNNDDLQNKHHLERAQEFIVESGIGI